MEHKHHKFVVDLQNRSCGCRKWDMMGIPCAHAFSAILYDRGKPEDIIYLMTSDDQWVKTTREVLEPSLVRTQPSRPKKIRI